MIKLVLWAIFTGIIISASDAFIRRELGPPAVVSRCTRDAWKCGKVIDGDMVVCQVGDAEKLIRYHTGEH